MLKERRTLVLVPRETPLSLVHLENLAQATRAGARGAPRDALVLRQAPSIDDLVDTVVGRVLDHLGVAHDLSHRWGSARERPRRPGHRRRRASRPSPRRAARVISRASRDLARRPRDGRPARRRGARRPRPGRGGRATSCASSSTRRPRRRRRGQPSRSGTPRGAGSRCSVAWPSRGSSARPRPACASTGSELGLEVAQVALGFGASELAGPVAAPVRRGSRWRRSLGAGRRPVAAFVASARRAPARPRSTPRMPDRARSTPSPTKVRARRAPVVRGRRRPVPPSRSRSPSASSPTRCASGSTATAPTSTATCASR